MEVLTSSLSPSFALIDHLCLKKISISSTGSTVYLRGGFKCIGKTLKTKELRKKDSFWDDFVQEVKLHSQQVHPNIVQLLGIHCTTDAIDPLIITEYLPSTLTDVLHKHTDIPPWMKTQFMLDIASGLSYLHSNDPPIIHYGLTSDTVLLTEHFQAKITDLSISRLSFSNTLLPNTLDFESLSNTLDYSSIHTPPNTFDIPAANALQSPINSPNLPTLNSPAACDLPSPTNTPIHSPITATNNGSTCELPVIDSLTSITPPTNTSNYIFMPPEFYSPDPDNAHTTKFDVFSFGCIAVHILSQQYPMPSEQFVFSPESFDTKSKEFTTTDGVSELSFVSEWSKRKDYLSCLPSNNSLVTLIEKCLSNEGTDRPHAVDIVASLEKEERPYSFTDGGILTIISELQNKENEVQNGVQVFRRKTKDYQAILDVKELTNVRLRNAIQTKDKKLSEDREQLSSLKEENNVLKVTNVQLQDAIDELKVKVTEFEKEEKVQCAVTLALENIKQEQTEKLSELTQTLEELSKEYKLLQCQLESETKEKVECFQTISEQSNKSQELDQQIEVMKENESRMESIMYNQQAQLEGLQQTISIERLTQNTLQKTANELQFLQTSLLDEQAELTDKYHCDVTALTELNEFNQLKLQIQQLEIQKLLKQNVSLQSSLYDARVNLKDQQQSINQLLSRQENQLSIVGSIKVAPPLFQQKRIVESLLKQKYMDGDYWCLISMDWFKKWEKYLTTAMRDGIENSISPGPVTNFMLMKSVDCQHTVLKDQLIKDLEYKLIPEIGWDLLIQWYGLSEKSSRLAKPIVKVKRNTITMFLVEIYPLTVQAILASSEEKLDNYQISRGDKVASILQKLRQHFKVPDDVQVRLWVRNPDQKVLLHETDTIGANTPSITVKNDNTLILDTKKNDTWSVKEKPPPSPTTDKYYYVTHTPRVAVSITKSNSEYEDMK